MSMHDTLPLGPLRLLDKAGHDRNVMREVIQQQFARLGWLGEKSYPCLYGIGGSFRAIAKIHMQENNYPLTLLHDYEIETGAAMELLDRLVTWPEEKIAEIPTAEKRQNQLPAAAMIMQELLTVSKAEKVVFSTSGIREGPLYSLLSPYLRNEDPLISSCAELAGQNGRHPGYPSEVFEWMDLAFKDETEAERRLRAAACILSELAWRIHRSSRGAWVYHRIIQSSLVGISHVERVALATALYHRYQPVWKEDWRSYSLLNDRWRNWAQAVGSAMSLAYYLSGGLPGNLGYVVLKPERGRPRLRMAREIQPLQGEKLDQLLDRFATASSAYNRPESAIAE
jgi:exopolyphosphatase/guanosine-5'-triphosphate,3'-diphosphate pyrophosphatase